MLVDVKGTNSTDPNMNHVSLSEPEEAGSLVDFVFLEVWRKEVTPSMGAKARLRIASPLNNDTLSFDDTVNTVTLTAGVDFQVSNSSPETARNLSDAINNYDGQSQGLTIGNVTVTSETRGTQYLFLSLTGGSQGNTPSFNITPNSNGILVVGVPAGGSDGEGKPNANKVYYSGNLDSHSSLYLEDNIQDPFSLTYSENGWLVSWTRPMNIQKIEILDYSGRILFEKRYHSEDLGFTVPKYPFGTIMKVSTESEQFLKIPPFGF